MINQRHSLGSESSPIDFSLDQRNNSVPGDLASQPIPKKSQQIKTDKPRPHICSICTRAFARLEHLKRHERSHTNEKPFQCAACGRCFARRDLVLRHQQKLHIDLPNIMRRSSSKDGDSAATTPNLHNEHIIVLHNNTKANAPLPASDSPLAGAPTSNSLGSGGVPQFRTTFFNQLESNSVASSPDIAPTKLASKSFSFQRSKKLTRPSSFSAASSSSYAHRDLHRFNSINEELSHNNVEFSTPQLNSNVNNHSEFNNFHVDWDNIESLDLNIPHWNSNLDFYHMAHQKEKLANNNGNNGSNHNPNSNPNPSANPDHNINSHLNDEDFDANNDLSLRPFNSNPQDPLSYHQPQLHQENPNFHHSVAQNLPQGQLDHDPQHHLQSHSIPQLHHHSSQSHDIPPPSNHPSFDHHFDPHDPIHPGHFSEPLDSVAHDPSPKTNPHGNSSSSAGTNMTNDFNNHPSFHSHHSSTTNETPHSIPDKKDYFHQFQSSQNPPNSVRGGSGTTPLDFGLLPSTNEIGVIPEDQSNIDFKLDSKLIKKRKMSRNSFNSPRSDFNDSTPINEKLLERHESISEQGDWLQEIINTPYEPNFIGNQIGFNTLSPEDNVSPRRSDEITSLFKSRQSDLSKQGFNMDENYLAGTSPPKMPILDDNVNEVKRIKSIQNDLRSQNALSSDDSSHKQTDSFNNDQLHKDISNESSIPTFGSDMLKASSDINTTFINEELRNRIVTISNLSDSQFPSLEELNNYMKLYEIEFNKYFPFIHLASLKNPVVDNFENIPLLLSMTSIGALYSYHDANTLLLFNLSKYHIQNFFEKEVTVDNLQFKKVPLMAHQCLVLHIFISMFLNEPNMIDITTRQMKSMVGLIKSTNFHKPLDQFLIPPKPVNKYNEKDTMLIQNNFDYFIMAQSRIRTIHVFYMLQVFRTSLLDLPVLLSGANINCGSHCYHEMLWNCENPSQWYEKLQNTQEGDVTNNDNGPNFSVVKLSNNQSFKKSLESLHKFNNSQSKLSFNNLLYLLIYIHEVIQNEFQTTKKNNNNNNNVEKFDHINWRLNAKMKLDTLIKSWESIFIKNDGLLVINDFNKHLLIENNEWKVILPVYYFAKIKIAINLTPIVERIVYKDWENMNNYLGSLAQDFDGTKEAVEYSLEIMNLWNQNISSINDSKRQSSLRTPVFFVTCVFVSLLVISQYLYLIEQIDPDKETDIKLNTSEKVLWLKCEKILKNCEKVISMNYSSNNSIFTTNEDYENYESIRKLIETNSNSKLIINSIKLIKLSNKCLFLGVRILADAPIWPLAMGFAEALKNRANFISKI